MAKDDRVAFRVPAEEKRRLEAAAARDGMSLSAWLRWLGEQAASEAVDFDRTPEPPAVEPAPAGFIPGFGLE